MLRKKLLRFRTRVSARAMIVPINFRHRHSPYRLNLDALPGNKNLQTKNECARTLCVFLRLQPDPAQRRCAQSRKQ